MAKHYSYSQLLAFADYLRRQIRRDGTLRFPRSGNAGREGYWSKWVTHAGNQAKVFSELETVASDVSKALVQGGFDPASPQGSARIQSRFCKFFNRCTEPG